MTSSAYTRILPNPVLAFVRRALRLQDAPEPPPIERESIGGYAYFMDENMEGVLYAKEWPYTGCPSDDRTRSTTWLIEGQKFVPSHRKEGNWIFRRISN